MMGPEDGPPAGEDPATTLEHPRGPDRSRDLFGVQLEVTSLLLEAERRKLCVLQREWEGGAAGAGVEARAEQELLAAIARIQAQHDQLEQEYRARAMGVLRCSNTRGSGKSNRSQPAIGLKQTPKARPTIFGTVASDQTPKDGSSRKSLPQTPQSSKGFGALLNGGGGAAAVTATENSGSSLESMHDTAIDADNSLVYRDGGNLVSGSLEALVQHMVPTADYYPDRAYLFAFLLSARLFIKPHTLLGQVCTLCDAQQHLGDKAPKERLGRFVPHLVQLLAEWTETFPYDFRDERVMGHVRSLTQKCVAIDPSVRREVSALLQALLLRLTALEKYEEFLQKVNAESSARSLDCLSSTDVTELCLNPASLAQQLTHIELERLSYIGPEEFVQAFAKENPNVETSFKDMKKTRNLESYVQWFNRLSYLVATEVCKHVKKKQRVKVMEYWIETARECFNIGNFNSLMAIIAGLNMSPISRLKKTWSKVPSAKFSILEHQMDPSSNFSSYRSTLKAAMWRSAGATDERQRIVIPFFSLLVKDLYFLNEGCSNKLPNGHINFEKFWQLAKQVTEFITWKQVTCPFEKNPKVITFLQASPVLTENALAIASFECEPPDNNHEKERYKTLRAELNS
ncbi:ras-GEF domain-containing family member 1B-like isoform X4 [Ischnura elegans]|uniref:ras-GEF domain-containing family member 1B-like isoform X4 n=1 Tax=Ischnura elegans TaxID=197161 RepID=UPI001ED8BEE3|nr:ras-GEF domain-containing family member 1B-like isoform X4 [Ischnura elegans]